MRILLFGMFFLYKFEDCFEFVKDMALFRRMRKSFFAKSHFLPLLSEQTAFAVKASDELYRMIKSQDIVEWKCCEKEIKRCETSGDAILSEFYEELYGKFYIPPVEREDMQTIALHIDAFLDSINSSAKSMLLYLPDRIDQQLTDMAQYIKYEADALCRIVSLLGNMKANFSAITMQCDRITELEHAADDAYEEYIGEIFSNERDAIRLMKYKNIAEVLEDATDSAKKVSDDIRKYLLRYM